MTLAELEDRMSSEEFDIWLADNLLQQDECPFCGVEPRDLQEFEVNEIKCPVCKNKYGKVMRPKPWQLSAPQVHSGVSQGVTHSPAS